MCLTACQAGGATTTPPPGATDAVRPSAGSPSPVATARAVAKPAGGAQAPEAGFSPLSPSPVASPGQTFALRSPAFTAGGALPADFSCDGPGRSPPLTWSGAPAGTRAYALVEDDADAAATQWVLYNMPITVSQLDAGVAARPLLPNGAQQGVNTGGSVGYAPACPDRGAPSHHLSFELFAQDNYITLQTGATATEVRDALNGHVIATAQLTATLQR